VYPYTTGEIMIHRASNTLIQFGAVGMCLGKLLLAARIAISAPTITLFQIAPGPAAWYPNTQGATSNEIPRNILMPLAVRARVT
jgi:hypothetical protein